MPVFPHDLHDGADVYSSDAHKLGELRRVVLKRSDLSLNAIVVDIGLLRSGHHLWEGGLGLDYDRVLPASAIASATDERVDLNLTAADFKDAPEYTAESFEAPQDLSPGRFDIDDLVTRAQPLVAALNSTPGAWIVERLNKPLDSVDIKEGIGVWRNYPHEKLGEVDRGLFDEATGRLEALVVRQGAFLHRDVILPSRYISEVIDDVSVRVEITDQELDQLQEFTRP